MTSKSCNSSKDMWGPVRRWLPAFLLVSWVIGTTSLWIAYALAPVGALATADAGNLVAIQDSKVITTNGYFHVSTNPSALLGIPLHVVRTNSLESGTGLQLCTERAVGDAYWCSDISDGYAGKFSQTKLARLAWSHGTMAAVFLIVLTLTIFGWVPAAIAVACNGSKGRVDGKEPLSTP